MEPTVKNGMYFGFTMGEMLTELGRYKTEMKKQKAVSLQGASVNGSSYTYGPNRDMNLQSWQVEIQSALSQLEPDTYERPFNTHNISF